MGFMTTRQFLAAVSLSLIFPRICFSAPVVTPVPDSQMIRVLKRVGFEQSEGYMIDQTLGGQNEWGYPKGNFGNLVVANGIGTGLAARLGTTNISGLSYVAVSMPIGYIPVTNSPNQLKFSIDLQFVVRTNTVQRDAFNWSFYNTDRTHLFSLIFDTYTGLVYYLLDDNNPKITSGKTFEINQILKLEIFMDLDKNIWGATLENSSLIRSAPMTKGATPVNIGYILGGWELLSTHLPRENYCLFDNFLLETIPVPLPLSEPPEAGYAPIVSTQFEPSEGYDPNASLDGRLGWKQEVVLPTMLLSPTNSIGRSVFPGDRMGLGYQAIFGGFPNPITPAGIKIT